jgi:hypothetical protein
MCDWLMNIPRLFQGIELQVMSQKLQKLYYRDRTSATIQEMRDRIISLN